jgi:tripartite-type tricarboxylate transporter receptor subunit TctC
MDYGTLDSSGADVHRKLYFTLALLAAATFANAQTDFPAKPVRWIAPFTTGGFSDILARLLGPQLTEIWKQQVVVENRPGAGGTVAAEFVLRAPADGYTLLAGTISSHAINVALRPNLSYHPLNDFAPVTMLAKQPSLLVSHPSLPARDFKQLIAIAKRNPGQVTYGTPGVGTSMHMSGELLKQSSGIDITHVPYKGGGAALTEVVGGHVPLAVIGFAVVAPQVKQGRLRALGITSAQRSVALPDVPTLAEQGVKDLDVTSWHAIYVKGGTPEAIVDRLNRAFMQVLARSDNRKYFEQEGAELVHSTPAQLAAFTAAEVERWTRVARAANITAH